MKYPTPVLEFRNTEGLDAPVFATFRLGGSLAQRLKTGSTVLLIAKGEAIGSARVTRVDSGPALEMLTLHALSSHLEVYGDGNHAAAVQRRLESLQKLYGPRMFNETRKLSVIYLTRKGGPNASSSGSVPRNKHLS